MRVEIDSGAPEPLRFEVSASLGDVLIRLLRTVEKEKSVSVQLGQQRERERWNATMNEPPA